MTRAIVRCLRLAGLLATGSATLLLSCADIEINLLPGHGDGGLKGSGGGGGAASGPSTSTSTSTSTAAGMGGADACDPTCGCGRSLCGGSCFDLDNDPSELEVKSAHVHQVMQSSFADGMYHVVLTNVRTGAGGIGLYGTPEGIVETWTIHLR